MGIRRKKQKYISLKEAAKISGYAPDYIGYLIRKGKIPGKRVYSGVACLTTEEAIKEYQEKIKNQKSKIKNRERSIKLIYDIFPPEKIKEAAKEITGFKPYRTKTAKFFAISWRLALVTGLIFLLIVINPIEVFQKLIGVFTEKEKTINLYSTLCMGNWQNPQNAQGQPEVLPSGDFNSFSETNSAVYKGGPLILFCQNFAPNSEIETTSPALIEQQEEGKPTSFFEKIKRFFGNLTAKAQQIPTFEEINKTKFLSAKIKFSFAINEKITEFTPILEEPSPEIPSTIESVSPPQEGIEEELGEIESEIEFTPELLHPIETTTPPISFWNKVKNFFGTLIVKAKTILSRIIPDIFVRAEEEISIIETVTPPQEAIIPEAGPEICAIDTTTPPTEAISPPPIEAEPLPIEEEQEELPQDILPNLDTKIIIWYSLDGELWWRLDTISSYPLSNALNDGYFSYDAPFLENWEDVRNLKIKFEGVIGRETKILAYLDSVWLEINYQEQKEKSEEPKKIFKMKIKDNSLIFPQLQKDFLINEEPIFIITEPELTVEELIATEKVEVIEEILQLQEPEESFFEKIKEKTGSLKEKILGPIIEKILPDEVKAQENKIKAQIFRPEGKKLDILPEINSFLKNGKEAFEVKIPKPKRGLKPGLYKLEIEFETAEAIFIVEQDFSWGVLAINTNKSIYLSGEKTYIQMAVLDNLGHTICDALLKLQIKSPRSQITTFSTEDGTIKKSPECGPKSVTYTPDYYTYYDIPDEIGVYEMHLIAESNRQKGARDTYDSFEVRRSVPFNIERMGPTRIYPKASYEMKMKIKANRSFKGGVIERIPDSFVIIEKNEKREEKREEEKLIIWGVDWKAGKTYELSYQFKTPNISPYLYLLGPLQIGKFQEIKQWQIVADAPDTWVQTTQADFDAGVLNQVDTSTNPGDVILDERDCWGSGGSCNASCQYSTRTGHTDLYSGDGACSATASCPNATYYTFSGTCSGTGSGSCYIQGSTTTRYTSCTQGSGCAGSCGGSCGPCSFFGSESECTFCGCSWTPSCTGSCSCPGKSESVCNNCNGCMWLSGDCQGECTCSGTSPAYCTSCGCTASGSCGGSCGCVGKAQDLCIGCMCNWNWTQWNWDASGAQTKRTAGTQCSWYDYYASGTIASQVHDSGKAGTFWGELSWNETLQASTDITFEVRASDTSFLKGDATPSWTGVGGNSPVVSGLPSGRYQQWRATLTTTNYGNTPTLHDVTITYTLATNISGTAQQYDQSTNAPDSETVKVAINGLAQTQTGSTSTGSWSIDIPSSSITSGDVVTIWIDAVADANEAVAVTKYDGTGDITGINLYERHLSIGSDDNQTITNSNLNQYDNSVSSDEDIFHEVDINNDLTVPASGTSTYTDQELIIKANNTHRPDSASSGNVTTPNLEINGTLTADGNTINLTAGGTPFVINGTFTASSSTFQYTANADTNITATTYYNLELIDPPKESPRLPTGQAPKQVTSNKRQATRDKFQTQNSNNQTVFGKIYQGFKENLLRFFDSLKKLLKIIAGYFKNISNIFAKSPKIIYALVEPDKVRPGDIMAVTAEIEDDYGIKEVRADMGEIEIIDLKLKEGNLYQGIWEAKWLVHDVEPREYITTITAINQKGKKSKVTLKWSDPIWDSTDLETRTISCDATVVGTNVQTDTTYSNIDLDFDPATVTISEIRCKVNFTSVNDGAS
ncbi:hypothetical protein KJA15_01075, partial [Patescibacteria group bacterium]|nr:hypothetical protein [Patescibacteria group bacterium]